jgi:hypothetical protein
VDLRPNPKKIPNSISPEKILFVKQRKIVKFPQKLFLHLVTLFLVCLRDLPFSELAQKIQSTQKTSNSYPTDLILAYSRRPIIKGLCADLILTATRFL